MNWCRKCGRPLAEINETGFCFHHSVDPDKRSDSLPTSSRSIKAGKFQQISELVLAPTSGDGRREPRSLH
jgi:hypothetical protein